MYSPVLCFDPVYTFLAVEPGYDVPVWTAARGEYAAGSSADDFVPDDVSFFGWPAYV